LRKKIFFVKTLSKLGALTVCFSCAPAWKDADSQSYGIFLIILGFILPLLIILYTSLTSVMTISKVNSHLIILYTSLTSVMTISKVNSHLIILYTSLTSVMTISKVHSLLIILYTSLTSVMAWPSAR
jgi:hypothetical protein